jgi:metal-dependent amidase/aminoacylase/carboxypeptidase family protein
VPAEFGAAINVTRSSGVAERYARWSPDGRTLAYWSDRSGEYELTLRDGYPPVDNDDAMTAIVRQAIETVVGAEAIAEFEPMMGAEDFALMLEKAPGCFIWLGGALKRPREHHHPEFDIDESVLVKGAAAMASIAIGRLSRVSF